MEKREIKFRAWDEKNNRMIESVGFSDSDCGRTYIQEEAMINDKDSEKEIYRPLILLQFTGLLDKNGKEIYEGDIIKIGRDLIEEIKWIRVGDWMGEKQPMVGFVSHGTIYQNSPIEIIGNIYENPELIT